MAKIIGFIRMKIERRARWDWKWRHLDRALQFVEGVYWQLLGKEVVECLGDSHVKAVRRLNWLHPEIDFRFRTVSVMGATAYGLGNQSSSSGAREKFLHRLSRCRGKRVLFMLGEVDTGFLIWERASKHDISEDEAMKEAIHRYQAFLKENTAEVKEVLVSSVPLPTLEDDSQTPEYISVRRQVTADKKQRTELALKFNKKLRTMAESSGWRFVDCDSQALDDESGLLKQTLMSKNENDHHYDENAFAELLRNTLVTALSQQDVGAK